MASRASRPVLHPLPTNPNHTPSTKSGRGRKRKQHSDTPEHVPAPITPDVAVSPEQSAAAPLPDASDDGHGLEIDENDTPVYLFPEEANMILEVLQKIDTDGLLDQTVSVAAVVFSHSHADQHEVSSTLRDLLEQPNQISLRHVHKATQDFIRRVGPRPCHDSGEWDRAKKFCELLNQLLREIIVIKGAVAGDRTDIEPESIKQQDQPRRRTFYTLFQQLPTGSYFSPAVELSKAKATSLPLAQAQAVAVTPIQPIPVSSQPTLGTLVRHKIIKPPTQEPIRAVKQAAYEPFSSFGPSFATEQCQVEQHETILALEAARTHRKWEKETWPFAAKEGPKENPRSRKARELRENAAREGGKAQKRRREGDLMDEEGTDRVKRRKQAITPANLELPAEPAILPAPVKSDIQKSTATSTSFQTILTGKPPLISDALPALDPSLFADDLLAAVHGFLSDDGKVERVETILKENASGLPQLLMLQHSRMRVNSALNRGTAEFQLAKAIEANLATLIDYQPRLADDLEMAPLVPPPELLHRAAEILPSAPAPGFKGTLRKEYSVALKDNTTVRAGAPATFEAPAQVPQYGLATPAASAYPPPSNHASQQRYPTSRPSYAGTATYNTPAHGYVPHAYNTSAQPYMAASGSSYPAYAGYYAQNGQGYPATANGAYAYGAPQQAYPPYGYGASQYAAVNSYTPTHQQVARANIQSGTIPAWSGHNRAPATALPPHMRQPTARSAAYTPTSPAQAYSAWPRV